MSCAALGGEEQGSICDAVAVRKWRTMCSSGSIVSPHPCPSLVFPPPSQTTASGCCPRWDTKLCLRLNVLDLPIHVKQRKLFLSSYCSRLEVVEPQCWVWAAETFTVNFLCAYESTMLRYVVDADVYECRDVPAISQVTPEKADRQD